MIVSRNLRFSHIVFYAWKPMLYFIALSLVVYLLHIEFDMHLLTVPFSAVATLSTALAIYLGFKNNNAYDRWWEARKIWGMLVNYSRAFARQILTLPEAESPRDELHAWQRRVLYRHIAFVHALRVFLRRKNPYNGNGDTDEPIEDENTYNDLHSFISQEEFELVTTKRNPPNYLNKLQGDDLRLAHERGWLSDFRFMQLDDTLVEFNNHQGASERIKNTPLPRPYSFYSRLFVLVHGTLVPFAFIEDLGWANIPLSLVINFVFFALDQVGEKIEDPFENRMFDTPLTAISITIEENVKELLGDPSLPHKPKPVQGVVL
jgi:ion channel-forming bestrophin family protein